MADVIINDTKQVGADTNNAKELAENQEELLQVKNLEKTQNDASAHNLQIAEELRRYFREKLKAIYAASQASKASPSPEQQRLRQQVMEETDKLISRGMEGYQEWVSAMAAIVAFLLLASKMDSVTWQLIKQAYSLGRHYISMAFIKPEIEFTAGMENGQLTVTASSSSDKESMSLKLIEGLQETFNNKIAAFLKAQGYILQDEKYVNKTTGQPMSQKEFIDLTQTRLKDGKTALEDYLSKDLKLPVKQLGVTRIAPKPAAPDNRYSGDATTATSKIDSPQALFKEMSEEILKHHGFSMNPQTLQYENGKGEPLTQETIKKMVEQTKLDKGLKQALTGKMTEQLLTSASKRSSSEESAQATKRYKTEMNDLTSKQEGSDNQQEEPTHNNSFSR